MTIAVAERAVQGTRARVAVWPPENLDEALAAVDSVLDVLDHQASRFREDSEISWIHRGGGGLFLVSDGLAGHEWGPGRVLVSFTLCFCPPVRAAYRETGDMGHLTVACGEPGCRSEWYDPPHEPRRPG